MAISLHCDRDGCDTWQREPAESFLILRGQGGAKHFCSLDHVMHWCAAHSEPSTTVDL